MNINTKHFIYAVCVALVLVGSSMQGASAEDVMCRGIVTGVPNFGGAVGVDGVNIRIDETTDQSGNLTEGDNVTVTWHITYPPFDTIDAEVGDRVEVCGEYCNFSEMPDGWLNVGDNWIRLMDESDHYVCVAGSDIGCRGIVTGVPDFGGAVGADGVNIRIDETTDQSGNLTKGSNVTVTWFVAPPFDKIDAEVGDRVEVYGECHNITEMPDGWSNVGDDWIRLMDESNHYVGGLDIRLTGIAIEHIEAGMIGAPEGWNVSVHRVISGQQLCSNRLNVTIQQTFASAGYVDPDIENGNRVCVYGSYYNDSDGCGVSLSWSQKYYIKKSSQWNAVDAVIALRLAASGESCVEQDMGDMDVNSDGRITSLDALMILEAALGRIQLR